MVFFRWLLLQALRSLQLHCFPTKTHFRFWNLSLFLQQQERQTQHIFLQKNNTNQIDLKEQSPDLIKWW